MQYTFTLMEETEAREICEWRYDEPYATYNFSATQEAVAEMLDRRSPYYAVRSEQGELIGFFCYGTSARVWGNEVPHLYTDDMTIDVGLGMRPDLTGKHLGLTFVYAGLDFAKQAFRPQSFRLFVLSFNERAIRVYERAGFTQTGFFKRQNEQGEIVFVEMQKKML